MNYCSKCKTKNSLIITNNPKWDKSETLENTDIKIEFECTECGFKHSEIVTFRALKEFFDFIEKYEI